MKKIIILNITVLFFCLYNGLNIYAEQLRGKIRTVSKKAKSIELFDFSTGTYRIFRYSDATYFINADSIDEFYENENIEIRFIAGQPLKSIKKMVVFVPPQKVIKTSELQNIIYNRKSNYLLIDSRPWYDFQKGHIPSSIWLPESRFAQYDHILPPEKNIPIIIYSDGVTSETAPSLARQIELLGFSNVKVYVFGFLAWRQFKQPILVDGDWLNRNLDPNKVLIDVRPRFKSLSSHIQTAVSIQAEKILDLGMKYRTKRRGRKIGELYSKRILPALPNKKAQIILYGDNTYDASLISAYQELLDWKYQNVVILKGGFTGWEKSYPIENSPAKQTIKYTPYIAKGSVTPYEFDQLTEEGAALILDIRTEQEVETGIIVGAIHIPLSELDIRHKELPKSKEIIVHCVNGIRAQIGYSLLKSEGFERVRFLNSTIRVDRSGKYRLNKM